MSGERSGILDAAGDQVHTGDEVLNIFIEELTRDGDKTPNEQETRTMNNMDAAAARDDASIAWA